MLRLKCYCCGFEQDFVDGEEAFQAGWDAQPYFSFYTACNLCPGSFVVLGTTHLHDAAHEEWKLKGRPTYFEIPQIPTKDPSEEGKK